MRTEDEVRERLKYWRDGLAGVIKGEATKKTIGHIIEQFEWVLGDKIMLESRYQQIYNCRRCQRAHRPKKPKQVFEQYLTSELFIIGQAAARGQVRCSGIPFHCPPTGNSPPSNVPQLSNGGKFLDTYLRKIGYTLSPYDPKYRLAYTTDTAKCYLGPSQGGKGDKTPSPKEIDNCKEWLCMEMALIKFRIILLLGAVATKNWFQIFEKGRIKNIRGYYCKEESFRYGSSDIPVYVLPHPASMVKCKGGIYDRTFAMIKKKLQSPSA